MSQTTFPFAPPTAPAGAPTSTADAEPGTGRNRLLLVLVAVLGIAVVAAGTWFFLLSGGSTPEPAGPVAKGTPAPSSAASPKPAPSAAPAQLNATLGRDPFKPLLVKPAPAPAPTAAPSAAASPAPSTATTGGAVAQPPKPPFLVTLLKVNPDGKSGWLAVNGTPFLTSAGGTFDTFFKVTSFAGGCASVQYGDVSAGKACPGQGLIIP